jgi:hypothetical protein
MRGNDYGKFGFAASMLPVSIDDLIRSLRMQFEQSLINEPVYIGDLPIRLSKTTTGHGGFRYWFVCPNCGARVGKLFCSEQTAQCRHCAAIKYPSSRFKGMVEEDLTKGTKA